MPTCIRNWIAKADRLQPAFQLYFAVINRPFGYLQNDFLSMAQALESYHRRTHPGQFLDQLAFQPVFIDLVNIVKDVGDNDFRESARNKLHYLPEFSLRKRLKQLIQENRLALNVFANNWDWFVDKVAATRNYLTHFDESLRDQAVSGHELFWLFRQSQAVMQVCFLTEISLEQDRIIQLLNRNENIAFLRRKLSELRTIQPG